MNDIVERLREDARAWDNSVEMGTWQAADIMREAADEIERLRDACEDLEHVRDELEALRRDVPRRILEFVQGMG